METNNPVYRRRNSGTIHITWICKCGWIGEEKEFLSADHPFQPGESVFGCPKCRGIESFQSKCDFDGCNEPSTCGYQTKDGYKVRCCKHQDPIKEEKMYGFFSQKSKEREGSIFYRNKDGKEIEVTMVGEDPSGKACEWSDKVYVGEVVKYSRGQRIVKWSDLTVEGEKMSEQEE